MTKKQSIIESAVELFSKQGIEATSIQQITAHSGISKGAFYLSFKSKEELILAIIDYYMLHIATEVDRAVKETVHTRQLFTVYFQRSFELLTAHQGIATIFLKEPLQYMSEAILQKMYLYDQLHEETIFSIVDRAYGKEQTALYYDVPYLLKGLFHSYSLELLTDANTLHVDVLSESLAEKMDILIRESKKPYRTKPKPLVDDVTVTQATLIAQIDEALVDEKNPLLAESLTILKAQLLAPTKSKAMMTGMLHNLETAPAYNALIYLTKHYIAAI